MTAGDRSVPAVRPSGLPGLGSVPWGTHLCQVYTSHENAAAVYVPFVAAGLAAGERCIVVADDADAESVRAALVAGVPRMDYHLQRRQAIVASTRPWFPAGETTDGGAMQRTWLEELNASVTMGFEGMRVYAMVPSPGVGRHARFEEQLMSIAASSRVLVVCAYAAGSCSAADIAHIVCSHQYMLVEESGGIHMVENLQWRRVSEKLSQAEERYRQLFEHAEEAILVAQDGMIRLHNPKLERILGYSSEDIRTMPFVTFIHPDDRARVLDTHQRRLRGEPVESQYSFRVITKDGSVRHADITAVVLSWEGRPAVLSFITDVTERERVRADLARSEERYRELWDNAPVAYHLLDRDGVIRDVNRTELALLGYERAEMLGRPIFDFIVPEQRDEARTRFVRKINGERLEPSHREYLRKDGSRIPVSIEDVLERDASGTVTGIRTAMMDVTGLQRAVAALNRSREQYRDLWENSRVGMFRSTMAEGRMLAANRELLRLFRAASFEGVLTPPSYVNGDSRERFLEALRARGEVDGFEAEMRRPDGTTFWASISARYRRDEGVIEGVMLDVTIRKEMEERLRESVARSRRTLEHTVHAIARIVELRDPYTAGHQRHVAMLARALAREMNLEPFRVNGVLIAGFLHDIGKVTVPVEILAKPGKINEFEFNMIKSHPQAGYDILKDIEFDWPVADIVLQHHERLDGSGYPGNVRGDALLPETRILSVADVVEAMASHRPYRPSLGIDKALEEIRTNRGRLYDESVVDACLHLFEERRFTFEGGGRP